MISVFSDKSTIILRKMLKHSGKKWVIHDFTKIRDKEYGIGQGRVQNVINEMERQGYIEREKRGVKSKTFLTDPDSLIKDWVQSYKFGYNEIHSFYSTDKNILRKIKEYFKGKGDKYALTLHAAANLYTSFVKTEDIYFYLNAETTEQNILDIRQRLDLKQLVQGGNVHIVKPYYKKSVFFDAKTVKGYRVVSDIQLYLDLYNFQSRGREHAEYFLKEKVLGKYNE
ncbi:MAG: hypothetical protein KKH08_01780 [Candidatus Omnitrophica bacterium]|nr:hypothetical protein [Candidatus Omnitrophota bacterium]